LAEKLFLVRRSLREIKAQASAVEEETLTIREGYLALTPEGSQDHLYSTLDLARLVKAKAAIFIREFRRLVRQPTEEAYKAYKKKHDNVYRQSRRLNVCFFEKVYR